MSPSPQIIIYTDGASRGNPGLAGAGVKIIFPKILKTKFQDSHLAVFLGTKTNNEAEYLGLLAALKFLLQLFNKETETELLKGCRVIIKMDSLLVVKQINGEWKIKEARMKVLAKQCCQIKDQLPYPVLLEHVTRDFNTTADWLANQAIDLS